MSFVGLGGSRARFLSVYRVRGSQPGDEVRMPHGGDRRGGRADSVGGAASYDSDEVFLDMTSAALCLAVCIVGFLVAVVLLILGKSSAKWPRADGVVLSSRVVRRMSRTPYVSARVSYEYRVLNRVHRGSRIAFGYRGMSDSVDSAESIAQRFATGTSLSVAYLPWRPSLSVLIPGIRKPVFIWLVFSLLLGLVCLSLYASGHT